MVKFWLEAGGAASAPGESAGAGLAGGRGDSLSWDGARRRSMVTKRATNLPYALSSHGFSNFLTMSQDVSIILHSSQKLSQDYQKVTTNDSNVCLKIPMGVMRNLLQATSIRQEARGVSSLGDPAGGGRGGAISWDWGKIQESMVTKPKVSWMSLGFSSWNIPNNPISHG